MLIQGRSRVHRFSRILVLFLVRSWFFLFGWEVVSDKVVDQAVVAIEFILQAWRQVLGAVSPLLAHPFGKSLGNLLSAVCGS